jgi:hypothetical protein
LSGEYGKSLLVFLLGMDEGNTTQTPQKSRGIRGREDGKEFVHNR